MIGMKHIVLVSQLFWVDNAITDYVVDGCRIVQGVGFPKMSDQQMLIDWQNQSLGHGVAGLNPSTYE